MIYVVLYTALGFTVLLCTEVFHIENVWRVAKQKIYKACCDSEETWGSVRLLGLIFFCFFLQLCTWIFYLAFTGLCKKQTKANTTKPLEWTLDEYELLQMCFALCKTELWGKDLVLEDPQSVLAALVPLCCLGCKWVLMEPSLLWEHRQWVPAKAAGMLFVGWDGKSELWKEWIIPPWRNLDSCFCSSENKLCGNKAGFGDEIHAGKKHPYNIAMKASGYCYLRMHVSILLCTTTITYS